MKHLLGLDNVSKDEILDIMKEARIMKDRIMRGDKKSGELKGKSVVNLFYENSTRTRLSFELAAKYLGADAASVSETGSSVSKGESLLDTALTINRMQVDVIALRHGSSGAAHFLAENTNAHIINAGDGMNEHPTQALLDIFTVLEYKETIDGLKVAIVGDIKHSRVARSNIYGFKALGAEVVLAAPETFMPRDINKLGVTVYNNVSKAIEDADVVMALRIQNERQKSGLIPNMREYAMYFGVDNKRLSFADKDCILLHPGPVNRGVEITSSVADGNKSKIGEQVTNGVAVRMAVLRMLLGRNGSVSGF